MLIGLFFTVVIGLSAMFGGWDSVVIVKVLLLAYY